jgi:DNA-binding NtrC family response regulator
MPNYNIYIVEDDLWYGEILQYHLSLNPDYVVTRFETAKDCLAKMHKRPDVITLDLSLPDMPGVKLYEKIREVDPEVPVIVGSYLVKDEATKDLLWNSIVRIIENQELKKEVAHLREELGQRFSFEKTIIGQSPAIKKTFLLMEKAIKTNITVSVTGETGTGKELVAKAIHYNSERKRKPFVAVNMAAIPSELIESELFGHEKGAFTGAVGRKAGKFEEANTGTIFLDEIAEMDLSLQTKLLRVLQEREITRVGGNETIAFNVRLIVATHKNLAEEVKAGRFRQDLFYRIMGLPIDLPPLRERGNDILILAKYFAEAFAKENRLGNIVLSQQAKNKLLRYNYPGNIRELKAMIELAAVMCENNEIDEGDVNFGSVNSDDFFISEEKTLRRYTIDIVKYYLKKNQNDVVATAQVLDIGKSTIYKMLQTGELNL